MVRVYRALRCWAYSFGLSKSTTHLARLRGLRVAATYAFPTDTLVVFST